MTAAYQYIRNGCINFFENLPLVIFAYVKSGSGRDLPPSLK